MKEIYAKHQNGGLVDLVVSFNGTEGVSKLGKKIFLKPLNSISDVRIEEDEETMKSGQTPTATIHVVLPQKAVDEEGGLYVNIY